MIPRPLAKYVADLVSFPGDAALAYRNEGLRGMWGAIAPRTIHRVVRASRLTVFAQPLDPIPDVKMPVSSPPSAGAASARRWRASGSAPRGPSAATPDGE